MSQRPLAQPCRAAAGGDHEAGGRFKITVIVHLNKNTPYLAYPWPVSFRLENQILVYCHRNSWARAPLIPRSVRNGKVVDLSH